MKALNQHISEKLILNKSSKNYNRKYFIPKNKNELDEYIDKKKKEAPNNGNHYGTKENPVDLSYIDFSELLDYLDNQRKDISYLFDEDTELIYVNASNWIFKPHVTCDFDHIFYDSALQYINVTNWQFNDKLRSIGGLFYNCDDLSEIEGINTWNTENIEIFGHIFLGCSHLSELNINNWNLSKANSLKGMFMNCKSLKTLDLSGWDVHNVRRFARLFKGCSELKSINGIDNWNVNSGLSFDEMFEDCEKLNININNWKINKIATISGAFNNLKNKPKWLK